MERLTIIISLLLTPAIVACEPPERSHYSCSQDYGAPTEVWYAQQYCEIWGEQWGFDVEYGIILFFDELDRIRHTAIRTSNLYDKVNMRTADALKEYYQNHNKKPAYVVALHSHPHSDWFSDADIKYLTQIHKWFGKQGIEFADFFIVMDDRVISAVDRGHFDDL